MKENSIVAHMRSNRWITFIILMFVLAVGITIGTLVSTGVDAERLVGKQLKVSSAGASATLDHPAALQEGFAHVAAHVGPSVVNINTESIVRNRNRRSRRQNPGDFFGFDFRRFFDAPAVQRVHTLGSGFLVDDEGYIITNFHVIHGANKIQVNLKDGNEYAAHVVGSDESTDIAVIKIDRNEPFPHAAIGDSTLMRTGDWVVTIGSPFNLAQTVTAGIISATGRIFTGMGIFNDYLQTDAAINRGNSGGPLVNMAGEVVGINTFIQSTTGSNAGIGFAIPSKTFLDIYNQLVRDGKVTRGWLGISMNTQPMTPEMAKYFGVDAGKGVIITQLINENGDTSNDGPAAKAGLLAEDVIVEIEGNKIETDHDLRTIIANTAPGEKVRIEAIRKGQLKTFDVVLAKRSIDNLNNPGSVNLDAEAEEPPKPQEIGLTVDDITDTMMRRFHLESDQGTIVVEVKPGSLAEDAGLRPNDILLQLNGSEIDNAQHFGKIFRELKSGDGAVIKYIRISQGVDGSARQFIYYTSMVKP